MNFSVCNSEEIESSSGHVMVQVVSRWPRTMNVRVVTRPFRVRFMVKKVAKGQNFFQVLQFPLSIPFHQCCIHIFILLLFLLEGQLVTGWKVHGSNYGRVKIFHTHPDLPCGPPILLCKRYWIFPGNKETEVRL